VIDFDCDVANVLNEMYQDHGDTIALQYGGYFFFFFSFFFFFFFFFFFLLIFQY